MEVTAKAGSQAETLGLGWRPTDRLQIKPKSHTKQGLYVGYSYPGVLSSSISGFVYFSMPLFSRSTNPSWLDSVREFCNARNITIVGWGPHALVVEAKSLERSAEISAQLAGLGFQPLTDPDDDYAGILTLSHPD